jgi:hypothetical protein
MMEAVRTSETSVDNHFTQQYNPEDSSEHHTRRRENLKSHIAKALFMQFYKQSISGYEIMYNISITGKKYIFTLRADGQEQITDTYKKKQRIKS